MGARLLYGEINGIVKRERGFVGQQMNTSPVFTISQRPLYQNGYLNWGIRAHFTSIKYKEGSKEIEGGI